MKIINTKKDLRAALLNFAHEKVAFVPTMGNLHAGHCSLVERAKQLASFVIVSIFVNPLQFGVNEDFAVYPRTLEADVEKLKKYNVDIIFAPDVKEIYPKDFSQQTKMLVPELSDDLCGRSRPSHFQGVATVVNKLFNLVQPNIAIFGEKDFQQLTIIRRMVADLCIPIEIVGVPTMREVDGLAMSSRNQYLNSNERKIAPVLYQNLCLIKEKLNGGAKNYLDLQKEITEKLNQAGFKTDYIEIRNAENLLRPTSEDKNLIVLGAAYLGKTRLIDNVKCF